MRWFEDRRLERRLRRLAQPPPPPGLLGRLEDQIPYRSRSAAWGWSLWLVLSGVAAVAVVLVLLVRPDPAWGDVLAQVAAASRSSRIHLVLDARSPAGEPFSAVDPEAPFERVEIWAEVDGDHTRRMRIERADRIEVFDGATTTTYRPDARVYSRRAGGGVDPRLVSPAGWVDEILARGDAELVELDPGAGSVVLRFEGAPLEGKSPWFFDDWDREVALAWDPVSRRLTSMTRRVHTATGWVLVEAALDIRWPEVFDEGRFAIDLPDDARESAVAPAAAQFDSAPPDEVARLVFEAAIAGDWDRVAVFCPGPDLVDTLRENPPVQLLELGAPFHAGGSYPGVYVPYAVRYRDGTVVRHDLALRDDNPYGRFVVDGGI